MTSAGNIVTTVVINQNCSGHLYGSDMTNSLRTTAAFVIRSNSQGLTVDQGRTVRLLQTTAAPSIHPFILQLPLLIWPCLPGLILLKSDTQFQKPILFPTLMGDDSYLYFFSACLCWALSISWLGYQSPPITGHHLPGYPTFHFHQCCQLPCVLCPHVS